MDCLARFGCSSWYLTRVAFPMTEWCVLIPQPTSSVIEISVVLFVLRSNAGVFASCRLFDNRVSW